MVSKKVLIIPPLGIGDIIMSFPVINYYKKKGYYVEILSTQKKFINFLIKNQMVDSHIEFNYSHIYSIKFYKERIKIIKKILEESTKNFEKFKIIVLGNFKLLTNKLFITLFKYIYIYICSPKIPQIYFISSNEIKQISFKFNNELYFNQIEKTSHLLYKFEKYNPSNEDFLFNKNILTKISKNRLISEKYIAFAPFSLDSKRRLPSKIIKQIILSLNISKKIVLIGGPEFKDYSKKFIYKNVIVKYVGSTFEESLNLIYFSENFIAVDSGPMHMGFALNKNVISLWNFKLPELRLRDKFLRNNKSIFIKEILFKQNNSQIYDYYLKELITKIHNRL